MLRPPRIALVRWMMVGLTLSLAYGAVMGKGGWLRRQDLQHQLESQRALNQALAKRNQALSADVADLKSGSEAIEEAARNELGMIKPHEVFYQFWPAGGHTSPPVAATETRR